MADLQITGVDEVMRRLRELPAEIVVKTFAQALDRAAGVIAAEVEANTPEGPEGLLAESVRVQVEVDTNKRGGTASVGFTSEKNERNSAPQDAIALWVETGHKMLTHATGTEEYVSVDRRGRKRRRIRKTGKREVGHVPAHPFMRPAFEASSDRAIQIFQETIMDAISKDKL